MQKRIASDPAFGEALPGFKPCLATWTLATTASKDARIEEIARQITVEHQAKGPGPVKAELASLVTLNALQKQQIMPEGNA